MKQQNTRIGTFNCQGIVTSEAKKMFLADDFEQYNLNALTIQETHLKGYGTIILTSSTKKNYILYYSGHENKSQNGVGIILPININANFIPINDRLCQVTIKNENNQKIHIVSA